MLVTSFDPTRRVSCAMPMAVVKLTIYDVVVKGYHECSFSVAIGDQFVTRKRRGERGNALRPTIVILVCMTLFSIF